MREHCYALKSEPTSIDAAHRTSFGGPLEELTDHPALVGFAQEFLAHPYLASEANYGFRMEMSFMSLRTVADDPPTPFSPHNGGGIWRIPGVGHSYHSLPGKAHAGLCRAIWEL